LLTDGKLIEVIVEKTTIIGNWPMTDEIFVGSQVLNAIAGQPPLNMRVVRINFYK